MDKKQEETTKFNTTGERGCLAGGFEFNYYYRMSETATASCRLSLPSNRLIPAAIPS